MKSLLKKTIFLILLVLLLLLLFNYLSNFKFYKNNSEVLEFETNKVHYCYISESIDLSVADCKFDTKLGKVNGIVVLKNETLFLFNKETSQAVIFDEIEPIFGFVFSEYVNLTKGVSNITYHESSSKPDFEFPENTEFINKKDMEFMIN